MSEVAVIAIVEEGDQLRAVTAPKPLAIEEHHRLVESLGDCLPIRYGTLLDPTEVDQLLAEKGEQLRAALVRVRGRREIALTVLWREAPVSPKTGHAYLSRKMRVNQLAREIDEALGSIESRHDFEPRGGVALSSALLVEAERAASAAERAKTLELPDARVVVNGPWPPYTFASL